MFLYLEPRPIQYASCVHILPENWDLNPQPFIKRLLYHLGYPMLSKMVLYLNSTKSSKKSVQELISLISFQEQLPRERIPYFFINLHAILATVHWRDQTTFYCKVFFSIRESLFLRTNN